MGLFSSKKYWTVSWNDAKAVNRAVEKINRTDDQDLLEEIVRTATAGAIVNAAVHRIKDQDRLYKLYTGFEDVIARAAVLEELTDKHYLGSIAGDRNNPMRDRIAAARKSGDETLYRSLTIDRDLETVIGYDGEGYYDKYTQDILPLLEKIYSEEHLYEIALRAKCDSAAEYAVERLRDPKHLASVAADSGVCQKYHAVEIGLFDEPTPFNIYEPLCAPRYEALMRLKDMDAEAFASAVRTIVLNGEDVPCYRLHILANHASRELLEEVVSLDDNDGSFALSIPYRKEQYGEYTAESRTYNVNIKDAARELLKG